MRDVVRECDVHERAEFSVTIQWTQNDVNLGLMLKISSLRAKIEQGLAFMALAALALPPGYAQDLDPTPEIKDSEMYKAATHLDVLLDCPDRLWPGVKWQNFAVTLEDHEKSYAVVWNQHPPTEGVAVARVKIVPPSDVLALDPGIFKSDLTGIVVSRFPDDTWQRLIEIAVHETFHKVQETQMGLTNGSRSYKYPENWEPRYLRQQIIHSLRNELSNDKKGFLASAMFWNLKLVQLYPDDIKRTRGLDIMEGTAKFVGKLVVSLATVGCTASDRQLLANAAPSETSLNLELQDESYQLGLLAGLLLEKKKVVGWRERVVRGETPLNVLLAGTQARKEKDDVSLKDEVKQYYQSKNSEVQTVIGVYKRDLDSPNFSRLAIPADWMIGSFLSVGPFINIDWYGKTETLTSGMTCKFGNANSLISLQGQDAVEVQFTLSGGGTRNYYVFPVPNKAFIQGNLGDYSINTKHITASQLAVYPLPMPGVGNILWAH